MIVTALIGTTAIISTIGIIYVTRKAWHGFHRAVGIEPGKMRYVPVEQIPFKPQLIQVNLTDSQLIYLPTALKMQLQRIDDKAGTYQDWRNELQQKHQHLHNLHTSENQFVLSKLMSEHLPDIISTYHAIHERKQTNHISQSSNQSSPVALNQQALSMLIELLEDIESRLDNLLNECEQQQLQDLQVMKRYLKNR